MSVQELAPSNPPAYEVGILLVHGIGQQRKGDTRKEFGEPLQAWLRRWLALPERAWRGAVTQKALKEWLQQQGHDNHGKVADVLQQLLYSAPPGAVVGVGSEPLTVEEVADRIGFRVISTSVHLAEATGIDTEGRASEVLEVRLVHVDGKLEEHRWLIAESWWANAFTTPAFADMARWAFVIVPWTVVTHFAVRLRSDLMEVTSQPGLVRWLRVFRSGGALLAAFVWAPLVIVTLALLWLLAALPVPGLRARLQALQRLLSKTIGDSHVLVTEDTGAAVMTTRVSNDLDWLAAQCGHVAVVAHSQGAALAHDVLWRRQLHNKRPVDLLLSFGSGLRKLHELRALESRAGIALVAAYVAVGGMLALVLALTGWVGTGEGRVFVGALGLVASLTGAMLASTAVETPELTEQARSSPQRCRAWEDLYASHDPVPNGKLFLADTPLGSRLVRNRASFFFDHNAYWRNMDEFVSRVVDEISKLSALRVWIAPQLDRSIRDASLQREWRVRWLWGLRMLTGALTLGVVWRQAGALGAKVAALLEAGSTSSWSALAGTSAFLQRSLSPAAVAVAGPLAVAFGSWVAYCCATWAWDVWDRSDIEAFFRREPYPARGAGFVVFAALGSLLVVGGVLACVMPAVSVDDVPRWALGMALGLIVLCVLVGPGLRPKQLPINRPGWRA